jgi:hypothetical protein
MQPASFDLADPLTRWYDGDAAAFDELVPLVYEALRQLARVRRRHERGDVSFWLAARVAEGARAS